MPTVVSLPKSKRGADKDKLLTADEFLDWLEEDVYADLIDGKIVMHSPVNIRHARLLSFVERLMAFYNDQQKLGGIILVEGWAVRLSPRRVFLPDICFFTKEQTRELRDTFAPFAPTLVVEAISPSSRKRDAVLKFAAYEEHGVREYWLLDPENHQHRFFKREGELLVEFAQNEAVIECQSIAGFHVERAWLDAPQDFSVSECFRQLIGG